MLILVALFLTFCFPEGHASCVVTDHEFEGSNCVDYTISGTCTVEEVRTTLNANFATCINIVFFKATIWLNDQIIIQNKTSIHFESYPTFAPSLFTCNQSNSGFIFMNISRITLQNLQITNCGVNYARETAQSSVHFLSNSEIRVINVTIRESDGVGLTMVDSRGTVLIESCTFEHNIMKHNTSSGPSGGLEIHHCISTCQVAYYTIRKCTFKNNGGLSAGRGGGLFLLIKGCAEDSTFDITNCTFSNNYAKLGGGLYIAAQDCNTIRINRSIFTGNHGTVSGGGIKIDLSDGSISRWTPTRSRDLPHRLIFSSCQWTRNRAAIGGAAVSLSSDSCASAREISTLFTDCSFELNANDKIEGQGAFRVIDTDVTFAGTLQFTSSNNSALYLRSSNATFHAGVRARFEGNRGRLGGAVNMDGRSCLRVNDNSSFSFVNNIAREKGGAIYHSLLDSNIPRNDTNCFIQYVGKAGNVHVTERKIDFVFDNNKAGHGFRENRDHAIITGNSIFVSTLYPCCRGYSLGRGNRLGCIANFTFGEDKRTEILTCGAKFDTSPHKTVEVVSGGWLQVPSLRDELGNKVRAPYHISVFGDQRTIMPENEYSVKKWARIYGDPGNNATLLIESSGEVWEVTALIHVHVTACPPGYHLGNSTEQGLKSCQCAVGSRLQVYTGIQSCAKGRRDLRAKMVAGYWMGYGGGQGGRQLELKSGYCPVNHCVHTSKFVTLLPNSSDPAELDRVVCGNRTGTLCARCRGNLTSYYHTISYECGSSEKCGIGWAFFLLSEIIPITLFFLVIIVFDINCTDGSVNGLIFYFQISHLFIYITRSFVKCPINNSIMDIFIFIVGMFNLKFFFHKSLSFCLWEGAQSLDLVMFRYVKIAYSLLLVLVIAGILKVCNMRKMVQKLPKVCGRELGTQSSTIHGLSGFLVMCYSECAKVSLILLTPITLHMQDGQQTAVPFFNGELEYFHSKHLFYAIPAVLVLLVFGLAPPLLLIAYPLCYRIFGVLKIGESKFTKILCMLVPLEKLKPLYDSIQGSFKDKHRYCAGLYFLYRLLAGVALTLTRDISNFYALLGAGFACVLLLHLILQPYKKRWHNAVDGYIFTTLVILSILKLYTFKRALKGHSREVHTACTISTIIFWVPLVYFVGWVLKAPLVIILQKVNARPRQTERDGNQLQDLELTEALLSHNRAREELAHQ